MLTLTRSVSEDADTRPRLRVLKSLFEPNCEPSPVASLLAPTDLAWGALTKLHSAQLQNLRFG